MSQVTIAGAPWLLVAAGLLWIFVETLAWRYVRPEGRE